MVDVFGTQVKRLSETVLSTHIPQTDEYHHIYNYILKKFVYLDVGSQINRFYLEAAAGHYYDSCGNTLLHS